MYRVALHPYMMYSKARRVPEAIYWEFTVLGIRTGPLLFPGVMGTWLLVDICVEFCRWQCFAFDLSHSVSSIYHIR